jgi:hypothetical protein
LLRCQWLYKWATLVSSSLLPPRGGRTGFVNFFSALLFFFLPNTICCFSNFRLKKDVLGGGERRSGYRMYYVLCGERILQGLDTIYGFLLGSRIPSFPDILVICAVFVLSSH